MMKFLILLLLPLQIFAQRNDILFRNVNVIDVKSGRVAANQNVLIRGNIIRKISKRKIAPKAATVIDASGKFLIPGLCDMHVHTFRNAVDKRKEYYFPLFIANGVTGVRDMWTKTPNMKFINEWREGVNNGSLVAPRFLFVGTLVDGIPPVWPASDTIRTVDEARAMVHTIRDGGLDFVKVYGHLSREVYFAIADECKKTGFPFAGHVPDSVSLVEAVQSGQETIEHLFGILTKWADVSSNEEKFKSIKRGEWTPALRMELLQSFSEEKAAAIAALMKEKGTWLCPTISVDESYMLAGNKKLIEDERLQYATESERKSWTDLHNAYKPESRPFQQFRFQTGLRYVNLMYKNGVNILAGTDVGNAFLYPGFSLHDELIHLVNAGLPPLAALQAATINPARYTGKEKQFGTVSKGKLADLVLLDANPLVDISNTKKINAVVLNGRLFQRKELDGLLVEGKEAVINIK